VASLRHDEGHGVSLKTTLMVSLCLQRERQGNIHIACYLTQKVGEQGGGRRHIFTERDTYTH